MWGIEDKGSGLGWRGLRGVVVQARFGLAIFYGIAPSGSGVRGGGGHNILQSLRSRILNNLFYVPIRMMEL